MTKRQSLPDGEEMIDAYAEFAAECRERITAQGRNKPLRKAARAFVDESADAKYSYNFEWLGRPIIQYPQDIVAMQEIIWRVKPDLIIETGIAHGGSLVFSASMLAILDQIDGSTSLVAERAKPRRFVLGIDIDIRPHNRAAIEAHPLAERIRLVEGSSISREVIDVAANAAGSVKSVLVCLDSNHTHDHVLAELQAYAPMVTPGSYCIVFDTLIEDQPENSYPERAWGRGNNPRTAVQEFLAQQSDFAIDDEMDSKLLISVAPQGYLRRKEVLPFQS